VGRSLDAGVNLFDTSNSYGMGESEQMLGKALSSRRVDNLIATKVSRPMNESVNGLGVSRVALMREAENSLRRLNTDYIDLYQIHVFDEFTPMEETLRALDDLVRHGKVRYLGVSNFTGWQIAQADGLATQLGTERFCALQGYYSLVGREIETEILPAVAACGMGTLVWSPLAGGFLTGKYTRDGAGNGRLDRMPFPPIDRDKGFDVLDVMIDIAAEKQVRVAQLALAWLLHKPTVSSVIIGANSADKLDTNLGAIDVDLTADEMQRLDAVSALPVTYPHWIPKQDRGVDFRAHIKNKVAK